MAAKKKTRKSGSKKTKSRKVTSKKSPMKKSGRGGSARKNSAKKRPAKKKVAPKKPVRKKPAAKRTTPAGKAIATKATVTEQRKPPKSQTVDSVIPPERERARSGGQSGDVQGLSGFAGADSESVDELLEEGNAFEADVVSGVERAGDTDEEEVHTHEVPEDDVPGEYLDED